jgi:trigger factor
VVQIENLGSLDRKMTVQFARADIHQAREARLNKISKGMKMPGFRPGKVPKSMVEKQYGLQVDFEVQYDKATELFYQLSRQEGLKLAGQPRLEPKSDLSADEIIFDAFFEVLPDIKMGDFSNSEFTRFTTEVNDPEIDRALDVLRKQRVHYHPRGQAGDHGDGGANTAVQDGDEVTLDFIGKIDGVEFAGGKADDFKFVVGAKQMLPEFEAAAMGLKAGESKTFPLKFPDDYHGKDVAGKTADFTITIKQVAWPHMPPVDDAFAESLGVKEGGVTKMREEVRENMVREVKRRSESLLKNQVMDELVKLCPLDVPKGLLEGEQERMVQSAREELTQRGIPNAKDAPIPVEMFKEQADKRVRLGLILGDLVKQQNLAATPEQIKKAIEELAATYEDPKEVVIWYYSDPKRIKDVEALVLEENVVRYISGLGKLSDKAVSFEELSKMS